MPEKLVYQMARVRNVGIQRGVYELSKKRPKVVRRALLAAAKRQLGAQFNMDHFTPKYNPWDERLCAVPDGDLFKVLKQGKGSVVTDHIETFTEKGIRLKSGKELEADMIITATGLDLQIFGDIKPTVDGNPVKINDELTYKGAMISGMPNFSMTFGYTNSSWTLKADMIAEYCCRLIKYMDKKNIAFCMPEPKAADISNKPFLDLQSGYVMRAKDKLPRQGNSGPWKVVQNYFHDMKMVRYSKINDGMLTFVKKGKSAIGLQVA